MSRPTANLRLFVGVYPPPDVAAAMLAALGRVELPPARVTPLNQVHLTLQFIGDTPSRLMDSVVESVERSASGIGAFELRATRLVVLPERPPHRLVALETDAPAPLVELQRRLAHRLASKVRERAGDRFLPHVTLARFALGSHVASSPALPAPEIAPFRVDRVRLMRSTLAPGGAIHHEVAAFGFEE